MTTITRSKLQSIREDVNAALAVVGQKHGVQLKAGNATYTEMNFTLKLEGSAVAADGTVISREVRDFQKLACLYGLQPSDLGRCFNNLGYTWKIVGLKPKSYKYPILAEKVGTGKTFKFQAETVKAKLA